MRYFYDDQLNELAISLLEFSKEKAKEESVFPWMILRKKAIIGICAERPKSIEELLALPIPLSKNTIQKYGKEIVGIVCDTIVEDDIKEIIESETVAETDSVEVAERTKQIDSNGIITIKQEGFYYSVSGNDALIFNHYFGYKLYGKNILRTGFPVAGEKTVLGKLDALSMNYDLLDKDGNIVVSKRFENNLYEIMSVSGEGIINEDRSPKVQPIKMNFKDKMEYYSGILNGLSDGVNVVTGEMVEGLDPEIKLQLLEMSKYFEQRLKSKERQEEKYPQQGQKWSQEEDEQLLSEYREGKTIKEISEIHNRSNGAIRSRLLGLGVLEHK